MQDDTSAGTIPSLDIRVSAGPDAGKVFPLREGFVGRQSYCEFCLHDPLIAPLHARITRRGGTFVITDLTDSPGVRVNNIMVKSRRISEGDAIAIADTVMTIVPAVKAGKPPKDEGEIVLVATESASTGRTQQLQAVPEPAPVPPRKSTKTDYRPSTLLKAPQTSPAYEQEEDTAKHHSRLMFYLILVLIVMIPLLVAGLFFLKKKSDERRIQALYTHAQEFARSNPDNYDAAIEKFRNLRIQAEGVDRKVAILAEEEIKLIQTKAEAGRKEFEDLLKSLDKKAADLAVAGMFKEAIAVFNVENRSLAEKVKSARKDAIEDLKKRMQAHADALAKSENEPKVVTREEAMGKLKAILPDVVEAMIQGNLTNAVSALELIIGNPDLEIYREKARATILSVKLLEMRDKTKQAVPDEKEAATEKESDDAQPPLIRAILAIRRGDLLEAQLLARKLKTDLLYDEIVARSKLSEEQQRIENDAISDFADAWSGIIQSPVTAIPKPADCASQLRKIADVSKTNEFSKLCSHLLDVEPRHTASRFITRYAEVFKMARELSAGTAGGQVQESGLGDARITDISGGNFIFEAKDTLPRSAGNAVAIFREKDVFRSLDRNQAIAARVEVTAVLPFKAVTDKQGSFTVPKGLSAQPPVVGNYVLVGKDLKAGTRMLTAPGADEGPGAIYKIDPSKKDAGEWKAVGGRVGVENGVLVFTSERRRENAGKEPDPCATFDLPCEPCKRPILAEFDIVRKDNCDVIVSLDGIQVFLSSRLDAQAGLYFDGELIQPAQFPAPAPEAPQHVAIGRWRTAVKAIVAGEFCESTLDLSVIPAVFEHLSFSTPGEIKVGKLKIARLPGTDEAKILAITANSREIIASKGSMPQWSALKTGGTINVLTRKKQAADAEAKTETTAATIQDIIGNLLFCAPAAPVTVDKDTDVALAADAGKSEERAGEPPMKPLRIKKQWLPETILGNLRKTSDNVTLVELDVPGSVTARGFVHGVNELVCHPVSKEPLAAVPAPASPCDIGEFCGFLRIAGVEKIASAPPKPEGVLLSQHALGEKMRIDLAGRISMYAAETLAKSPQGWKVAGGSWQSKGSRLVSGESSDQSGQPAVILPNIISGNFQLDVDLAIDKAGAGEKGEPAEAIVEIWSPLRNTGLALELGTAGISFSGSRISVQERKASISSARQPLETSVAWEDPAYARTSPVLKASRGYNLRVRRVDNSAAFYLNGKRIAVVSHPAVRGDVSIRIGSPCGSIGIGKTRAISLSKACTAPQEEPDAGEFGYVLAVDGQNILIDSDMNNITPNSSVSIMRIDKALKGDASKTVIMTKIAAGTVAEVGPRTAKVLLAAPAKVEKGMKVLPGLQPESLNLASARLLDIDEGL